MRNDENGSGRQEFTVEPVRPAQKHTSGHPAQEFTVEAVQGDAARRSPGSSPEFTVEAVRPAKAAGTAHPVQKRPSEAAGTARPAQKQRPVLQEFTVEAVRPAKGTQPSRAPHSAPQEFTVEAVRPTQKQTPAQTSGTARPAQKQPPAQASGTARPAQKQAPAQTADTARPAQKQAPAQASDTARPAQKQAPAQASGTARPAPREFTVEPVKKQPTATPVSKKTVVSEEIAAPGYRKDAAREAREKQLAEKQREAYEKEKALEQELSLFTPRTKERNYFINLVFSTLKALLILVIIIGVSGTGLVLGMAKSYLETVPELDFSLVTGQEQSTTLFDKNEKLLCSFYNLENREWATLDEFPDYLKKAVIGIEDVRFYRHLGIDFKRLFGAFITNLASGSLQGGSTLTQQLIKNTILSSEQTYKRKLQEAYLALELEKNYSKEDILEAYLNTIYMGGSCYGMKTAAMEYFGKSLSELSLRECATLAGMIQNPSRYNPRSNYYSRKNPDRTNNRTDLVLFEMRENGLLSQEEYDAGMNQPLTILEKSPYGGSGGYTYFTDYVLEAAVNDLLKLRGMEDTAANRSALRKEVRTGGYKIYTTIDPEVQKSAEEAVYNFKGYPNMRSSSESYTVTGRNPDGTVIRLVQPQTAAAVVDYHNGYISALVGGRQAPAGSLQFNRAYQSTMPVGSSIKPIAVYGPAIDLGKGPGSVYYNLKLSIDGWDSALGYPENNNRSAYYGITTMRQAITASYNTTAAQALMYDVGLDASAQYLENLGVAPEHISKTGSGLALGSSGITPLEMATAYCAIANGGSYIESIPYTKITDSSGNMVIDKAGTQETHRVFSEATSWMLTDLMYSVCASGTAANAKVSGQTVYGKTGTNSENRGIYFAGFTGYYTCAVWIGSDAYKRLTSDAQGGKYAAPLFSKVMTAVHKGLENRVAQSVSVSADSVGVEKVQYCRFSGMLATSACSQTVTEWGCPSNMKYCTLHTTIKICKASGLPATSACPQDQCETVKIVAKPTSPMLKHMYSKHYSTFVSYIGKPSSYTGECTVHKKA